MNSKLHVLLFLQAFTLVTTATLSPPKPTDNYISAVGDPGMKRDGLRLAFEAWNFCNEVGREAPATGSPRAADCFDFSPPFHLTHRVSEKDNNLSVGTPFPNINPTALNHPNLYASEKELYLGSLCEVADHPNPWHFWMIMLKNGNFDTNSGLCPHNGKRVGPFTARERFPCFGVGCMNQPVMVHRKTEVVDGSGGLMRGSFRGSYDYGWEKISNGKGEIDGLSYFEVVWEKKAGVGSWVFRHKIKTTKKYPWLMLYLRADASRGFSGGYRYDTRGMLKILPESPNFKVRLTLYIQQGGGPNSQFYLLDIGGCWKNDGYACDGDVLTDVTRYSEMIINPETPARCNSSALHNCPPFHITPQNKKIYRNDTKHFPYSAYHIYCAPGNARHLEQPVSTCDPYSNPQAQEILQLLPHPVWGEYGYPTKKGDGWIGDPRTWELDVGGLASRLYFYQDPGTRPARRRWSSIDVGTEIYDVGTGKASEKEEVAEWSVSDFDVLLSS